MRKQLNVYIKFHIRMDEKMYESINKLSYLQKLSKAEIVRQAIQKHLDELKIT
jgi:predicted DNA-binding protein